VSDRSNWIKLLAGQMFGEYKLLAYINGGEYGYVFEAEQVGRSERVAVKVLRPSAPADETMEFQREGELLQTLRRSSGVIDLYTTGHDTVNVQGAGVTVPLQVPYHVLELAEASLERLITAASYEDVPWLERLQLWRGLILGVHQMHTKSLVHRDLKSSNCLLLVTGARSGPIAKLGDLGKARDLNAAARYPSHTYLVARGDLRFAPPELLLWQGKDNPESYRLGDLYGLGSLLFEMATGIGITQCALGFGPEIVSRAQADIASGVTSDLSALRPAYSTAFEMFANAMPRQIRHESLALLRQLCDPEPEQRLPRRGFGRRRTSGPSLDWLLRKTDILIKRMSSNG
jgi:eukaryotic-like serine/threonine-protein kinase